MIGAPPIVMAGLTLVMVVFSGCSAEADSGAPVLPSPLPRVVSTDELPIEKFSLDDDEVQEIREYFNAEVARCAARFGIDLKLVRDDPQARADPASRMWAGRFGTLTESHAKKFGYHAAPGTRWRQSYNVFVLEDEFPRSTVIFGADDPRGADLVDRSGGGVPQGGCRGEVSRRLGGDPYRLVPDDVEGMRLAAVKDARSAAAMGEWSECMKVAGYAYSKVDQPVDEALGVVLSDRERDIAVADVRCTAESRWRDISFAIEKQPQVRYVEENRRALTESLAAQRRMLKVSRAFANAGRTPGQ